MRRRNHYYPRARRPTWRQDTPDEQFVAVMQSLEGWVGNLERGISPQDRCIEHIRRGLDELKGLQAYMGESWDEPVADTETPSEAASEIARLREENRVLQEENETLQASNESLLEDLEELSEELEGF
jgi:hypothetical protein